MYAVSVAAFSYTAGTRRLHTEKLATISDLFEAGVTVELSYARLRQTMMMLVLSAVSGSRFQSPYCPTVVKPL